MAAACNYIISVEADVHIIIVSELTCALAACIEAVIVCIRAQTPCDGAERFSCTPIPHRVCSCSDLSSGKVYEACSEQGAEHLGWAAPAHMV